MADYDAIVIGAGHNGLAAATTLAKEGQKVLCVEKTNFAGGQAATKELFKGFKHNVGAWALLVFRNEMLEKLGLEQYNLEFIRPRSSYVVFGAPEDPCFVGYTDENEMAEHLMTVHGQGALEGLANMAAYLQPYKDLVERELFKAPGKLEALIAQEPDAQKREVLIKTVYGSAMDILRQFFPEQGKYNTILGSLCASAIDGTHMGPFTPGTGLSLAYHYTTGDAYDFRTPKGGIGALSNTLARSVEDRGGKIEYRAPVKRLLIENGTVTGVELKSGETISAKAVLSSIDARATFLGLAGEENLPSDFVNAVKEIVYTNGYVQVHMTLSELPEFSGHLAFANEGKTRWIMSYIPSPEHLARCWEQYERGEVPDDPVSYACFPSMMDPSLSPEGQYTCTIFSHYFPANPPKDKHKEMANLMAERAIDKIAMYSPNFRKAIMDKVVLTQQYFEATFGVTQGDFASGLIHPWQMWDRRPVPGWSNYRTPLKNLFMCGAACHPGPGVTCMPGYNGARTALADLAG